MDHKLFSLRRRIVTRVPPPLRRGSVRGRYRERYSRKGEKASRAQTPNRGDPHPSGRRSRRTPIVIIVISIDGKINAETVLKSCICVGSSCTPTITSERKTAQVRTLLPLECPPFPKLPTSYSLSLVRKHLTMILSVSSPRLRSHWVCLLGQLLIYSLHTHDPTGNDCMIPVQDFPAALPVMGNLSGDPGARPTAAPLHIVLLLLFSVSHFNLPTCMQELARCDTGAQALGPGPSTSTPAPPCSWTWNLAFGNCRRYNRHLQRIFPPRTGSVRRYNIQRMSFRVSVTFLYPSLS